MTASEVELVPLRDLGHWVGGGTPSKAKGEFWSGGSIPWVSPKDMKLPRIQFTEDRITPAAVRESATSVVQAGSVLIVIRSGILRHTLPVAVADVDVSLNQDMKALTPGAGVLGEYVAWALRAHQDDILSACAKNGTTVQSIDFPALMRYRIPLPDLTVQTRLVATIETHLSRIAVGNQLLLRARKQVARYRAAVLKAACEGRLVPPEAEIAASTGGEFENAHALIRRAVDRRKALTVGRRKGSITIAEPQATSEPLPPGWAWATWDQIGVSQNGRAFPSSQYSASGMKLLRPGNLHVSGRLEWSAENTRRLPEKWALENADLVVRGRELVMNLTAQSLRDEFLGRICLTDPAEECLLNQRLARLTPIGMTPEFALVVFKSPRFRRFVDTLNSGSLIQHMFTSQLAEFQFPLPPLAEQNRIAVEVERRLMAVDRIERAAIKGLQQANGLRQSILQAAFSGSLVRSEALAPV